MLSWPSRTPLHDLAFLHAFILSGSSFERQYALTGTKGWMRGRPRGRFGGPAGSAKLGWYVVAACGVAVRLCEMASVMESAAEGTLGTAGRPR